MIIDLHQDISTQILESKDKTLFNSELKIDQLLQYSNYGLILQTTLKDLQQNKFKVVVGASCALKIGKNGIYVPINQYKEILAHLKIYSDIVSTSHGLIKIINDSKDLDNLSGRTGLCLSIEGLYCVDNDKYLKIVDKLFKNRVRIIGPLWNIDNSLGGGSLSEAGLTDLGKRFIEYSQNKGIIIDCSHMNDKSMQDTINISKKGLLVSHTLSRAVYKHKRNVSDMLLRKVIDQGGLIGLCFVGTFSGGRDINLLKNHIQYLINTFGIDSIAIGSDFGAMSHDELIENLEGVNKISNFIKILKELALSNQDIDKILYRNAFSFLKQNLP